MAATVGELVVNLVARTAAFNAGMQQSQQQVAQFSSRLGAVGSAVGAVAMRFAPMISGVVLARKAFHGITETLDNLSMLSKQSQRLGMVPADLEALKIAAAEAGSSAETMMAAIAKLQTRLGQASHTGKGLTATLKEIGLSAAALADANPARAMEAIAAALENVDSGAQRARIAVELFGKSGLEVGESLRKLKEAQENVKYWDLGNPMAVAAGVDWENFSDQLKYAAQSGWEHMALGAELTTKMGLGFLQGGPQGAVNAASRATSEAFEATRAVARQGREAAEMQREMNIAASRLSGQDLVDKMQETWSQRGLSDWQKRIQLWREEAAAVGMDRAEILAYAVAMATLGRAQEDWEAGRKRDAEAAGLIRGQLTARGGDGAELAPLATMGSLAAYQAIARQGLQPTAQKTNEQIAQNTARLLEVERTMDARVAEIAGLVRDIKGGGEVVEIR